MKPTEKQLNFIKSIEKTLHIKFDGKTKEEARQFISDNVDKFNIENKFNRIMRREITSFRRDYYGYFQD
jgi:hypothetical protein